MTDTTETFAAPPAIDFRARNKIPLFAALAAAGIHRVTIDYDGSGDSGQFENVEAWDANNQRLAFPSGSMVYLASETPNQLLPESLEAAVETLAWDYLGEIHMGWEDGEGAYGTFVFDVPGRTIKLQHNERYTEVNTTSHEF